MKKAFIVLLVVVGLLFTAGNAFGVDGTAYATILSGVASLTADTDMPLRFGGIVPSITDAGTITLTPYDTTGAVVVTSTNVTAPASSYPGSTGYGTDTSGNPVLTRLSAGKFNASALTTTTKSYDLYLPSVVELASGVNKLYVKDFTAYLADNGVFSKITEKFSVSTAIPSVFIGATLEVPASASSGTYSGTYSVYLYEEP